MPLVISNSTTTASPDVPSTEDHVCKLVLYLEIPGTKVRLWDVIILLPNLAFLMYLICGFHKARLRLRATNSPIFLTLYSLVVLNVVISVTRCLVLIGYNAADILGDYVDIILWVVVRFFLLATEISVIIFGLAFGHLDSRSSIRCVLVATSAISFVYSVTQGSLEILLHDEHFYVNYPRVKLLFGHGGVLFWFITSVIFSTMYFTIILLPWTSVRDRIALPGKKCFYVYVTLLMLLNISCSVGGGLLLSNIKEGLCVVDLTTCIYFTFFTPLVYYTFLSDFFSVLQPNILFSYKSHDDSPDEDTVSLPRQHSFSSTKNNCENYFQPSANQYTPSDNKISSLDNPLYVASLQSPDSITGYSLTSEICDLVPSTNK